MYFVMRSTLKTYKGRLIRAIPEDYIFKKCSPAWWLGEPFRRKPKEFIYSIEEKAPRYDVISASGMMPICSQKFLDTIQENDIKFESFPVTVLGKNSKMPLDVKYYVFHLLEIKDPGIDVERSIIYTINNQTKIEKLEVSAQVMDSQPMMFFAKELGPSVFVHQNLVKQLEENKITGLRFIPLEQYTS
ncbi:Imm43 family immunity protein [Deinococcus cellulosilyticus]|uniref:Immunity MXAN-0049 protein domain-containing protein n=1 Tax=Deinococcus cellulosilyticus (strain DSM 18568 / NBRC 106333 / KACC 11606 / 5516J-15) TaxID=1223518 RepID=A0A511NB10_DEIC1|nr:DUF1629 domain-containing protein [Deinococcus cellulosilyticus]GEM49982.1 hypothetical protein DC3_56170 [Deinococcus cellulosilyticus NBRC 106333 = KACC 11606]